MTWCAAIQRLTSNTIPELHGLTPDDHALGSTPDILLYSMFVWYQVVYDWIPIKQFPQELKLIGRWIGVSQNCVDDMAFVILVRKGLVVIRKSIWGLSDDYLSNTALKAKTAELNAAIMKSVNIPLWSIMPLPV
jgi:hypothetical protein